MEYLRAFPPHYTLFTQMNELHGKLQLLPLRPVGRLHGHEECVEDTMNIGWLSGHGLCLSVCGCVCVFGSVSVKGSTELQHYHKITARSEDSEC